MRWRPTGSSSWTRPPTPSPGASTRHWLAACASCSACGRTSTWSSRSACHLFTLLGPASAGKSRLVAEFLVDAADTADVLHSRCLHYGEDITYWPLVEILVAIGADPADVIGSSPVDTQHACRKLLEARAAERPQIVLLDDIQWAEPLFLDLIEHVADLSRDAPIFLLCVARPELLELRPGWGGGKLNATTILLEALAQEDCETPISRLAGGAQLTDAVRQRILATAGGNPLFIEEMLALVKEDGGDGDVVVPPDPRAAAGEARPPPRRGARRRRPRRRRGAGVPSRDGARARGELEAAEVGANLVSLVRKEVIRPDQSLFPDDEAFRFRHLLIRDAAYESLPKEMRAELHERFADWLDRHAELVEQDEIVGYHLESAHRNRAELDGADPRLDGLARRAAARLHSAARGARARGDHAAVAGLLRRAVALLPEGDPERLEALILLGDPLSTGVIAERRNIAAELARSPDPRYQAGGAMVELWTVRGRTGGWRSGRRLAPRRPQPSSASAVTSSGSPGSSAMSGTGTGSRFASALRPKRLRAARSTPGRPGTPRSQTTCADDHVPPLTICRTSTTPCWTRRRSN